MKQEWIKEIFHWVPTAPIIVKLVILAVLSIGLGWYLFIYQPHINRINIDINSLKKREELVTNTVDGYIQLENKIWKALEHLRHNPMSKDDIVKYIKPLTQEASSIRTQNRARKIELGALFDIATKIDVSILLCFSQIIVEFMPKGDQGNSEIIEGLTLKETVADISSTIESLSYPKHVYQKTIERGVSSLDDEEYETYIWLLGEELPSNKHYRSRTPKT
uniref:Uncharacterized protein n=1 Tax=Candidatus Kentrum sp. LPFa TaxID=2126335 RepID=A0A450WM43_9GAMM|nr:MAG: hypothetical protein BECKLPF1236B_GA0070989_11342 [Candidatus Kentron sp. LPFa]